MIFNIYNWEEVCVFPAEIEKHLAFAMATLSLVTCTLQTKIKGLKTNSFKNIQELLFLGFANNVVSDRELDLLCDAYQSKVTTLITSNMNRSTL